MMDKLKMFFSEEKRELKFIVGDHAIIVGEHFHRSIENKNYRDSLTREETIQLIKYLTSKI